MARSRNIKPALFKNEVLGIEDPLNTLLYIGLWGLADREGRLEDRPLRIKAEIFPYRDLDINVYLTVLERLEFICRYTVENKQYIHVLKFNKHQNPHKTERQSEIPKPPENYNKNSDLQNNVGVTVKAPLNNGTSPADSLVLIPDSLAKRPSSGKPNVTRDDQNDKFKDAVDVIEFLNERSGRMFKAFDGKGKATESLKKIVIVLKTIEPIQARRIIILKSDAWMGNDEMAHNLNPITLFGRKSNLEKYLVEVSEKWGE